MTATDVLSLGDGGCNNGRVQLATLEPRSGMELLINVTANSYDQRDQEFKICWKSRNGKWRELETHNKNGTATPVTIVQGSATEDTGSRAAPLLLGSGECCEGLRLGEICLPGGLIIFLWIIILLTLLGMFLLLRRNRNENDAILAERRKRVYEGFDVENDAITGLLTPDNRNL